MGLQLAAVSVTQWRFWYRIEATQQRSANMEKWIGQPFQWGPRHYHYYWNIQQSPILIQLDNVYQVIRLQLGDERYRLKERPDPWVSNPVDNYPVNSLVFWWANDWRPLFGVDTRIALARGLAGLAAVSLALLVFQLWRTDRQPSTGRKLTELELSPAEPSSG
jgi:hypothetical protein